MADERRFQITQRQHLIGGAALVAVGLAMIAGSIVAGLSAPKTAAPPVSLPTETTVTTVTTATTVTAAPTETTVTTTVTTTVPTTTVTTTVPTTTTAAASGGHFDGDGSWNLILVNPQNAWTEAELSAQTDIVWHSGSVWVDSRMVDALNAMLADGAQYGLWVCSGYRDYGEQEILFNREVEDVLATHGGTRAEAEVIAATEVARPGTSGHHTGLAVDLLHSECWELEEYWDQSAAFDWMMAHCADYGFILRYPKNKQHITGVIYEPWHYRYVGVTAAKEIMSRSITLEEYLQG